MAGVTSRPVTWPATSASAGYEARPAGYVHHGIFRADPCHVDEEPVRLVVRVGRQLRKRDRLSRELVEDQAPMLFRLLIQ
jgi:hypothetical protein